MIATVSSYGGKIKPFVERFQVAMAMIHNYISSE